MKKRNRTIQVNVMVSKQEKALLEKAAEEMGVCVSAFIRVLVKRDLDAKKTDAAE